MITMTLCQSFTIVFCSAAVFLESLCSLVNSKHDEFLGQAGMERGVPYFNEHQILAFLILASTLF